MTRFFGWIFFVVLGVGGTANGVAYLFSSDNDKWALAVGSLLWGLFWLWLAGSYMLGLY